MILLPRLLLLKVFMQVSGDLQETSGMYLVMYMSYISRYLIGILAYRNTQLRPRFLRYTVSVCKIRTSWMIDTCRYLIYTSSIHVPTQVLLRVLSL